MKNIFYSAILCAAATSASAEGDSREKQIKLHCKALGGIAFLAVEKYKTGREMEDVKKELSSVVDSAATTTNGGIFSDQFLEDYNKILVEVYSTKQRKSKDYAVSYIKKCQQR